MIKKKKIMIFSILILIFIVISIIIINLIPLKEKLEKISEISKKNEDDNNLVTASNFKAKAQKVDINYVYYLLKFKDPQGIEKIIYPNGMEIALPNKTSVTIDYAADPDEEHNFKVINSIGEEEIRTIEKKQEGKGILQQLEKVNESGISDIFVRKSAEEVVSWYSTDTIVYSEDLVLDGSAEVEGASLSNNVYTFGNSTTDIGTGSKNAENAVVIKVNGNLTINQGITVTAVSGSYGGPKGLFIYVTGTLTNNGNITMSNKGAKSLGENVYLWLNNDESYEFVPAYGSTGGVGKPIRGGSWSGDYIYYNPSHPNTSGAAGVGRGTAGGASGGCVCDMQESAKGRKWWTRNII